MTIAGTLSGTLGNLASGSLLGSAVGSLTQSVAGTWMHMIDGWVLGGARAALDSVAHLIGSSTTPNLTSTWFSASYWRVAGLATLLTLPFLFAAAVHALARSDLLLLFRAALVQLPLALLAVSLAAPMVTLMLAATDQMSALVAGPGVDGGAHFLASVGPAITAASTVGGSPLLAIVIALLTVAGALMLMVELLIREGAVYVVVLMLPLAFAALVWPARRVWAIRLLELLTALILSKFVIVAVLSLAGSALGHAGRVSDLMIAMTLVLLSCMAPWVLFQLIPFTEIGAAASQTIRHHTQAAGAHARGAAMRSTAVADGGAALTGLALTNLLRRQAVADGQTDEGSATHDDPGAIPSREGSYDTYGQGSSPSSTDGYAATGSAAVGLLPLGSTPTQELGAESASDEADAPAGDSAGNGDSPAGGEPAIGGVSPDGASDAERAPEPAWWDVEDMSLPGIHLGMKGLGGPDWVPPTVGDAEPGGPESDQASGAGGDEPILPVEPEPGDPQP